MKLNLLIAFLIFSNSLFSQGYTTKNGDLLFQDLDCGDFCDAIEKVTQGVYNYNFSHVGILVEENGNFKVIEAGGDGVVYTPLNEFLNITSDENGNPKVVVGRLKNVNAQSLGIDINKSVELTKTHLGKPYDDGFVLNNNQFYCSELVYECFLDASGNSVFQTFPMTFKDPETNEIFPAWDNYFDGLTLNIPEGELGLNPGGISRSLLIEIVHQYGNPSSKE